MIVWPLRFGLLLDPGLLKEDYSKMFEYVSFDYTAFVVSVIVRISWTVLNRISLVALL